MAANSTKQYTIGIDFGSLSARAVLMDIADGSVAASCVYPYPHAVLSTALPGGTNLPPDWALQVPADYRDALKVLLPQVLAESGVAGEQVLGIGLDVTSTTMLPVTAQGKPLCEVEGYENNPHAYIKMWKHHAAQRQAERIEALARQEGAAWLSQFGGSVSGEHFLPKAAQIAEEAPELYENCGRLCEVGDWLVWELTGQESRGYCAAAYKTYYNSAEGDVSGEFLGRIHPLLAKLADKLPRPVVKPGDAAGTLTEDWAKLTGLQAGTPVSAAGVDAHVTAIGSRSVEDGDALLIVGTSTCVIMLSEEYREPAGLNGVVPEGIVPKLNAYEGGQAAVGDMFAWFCENCVPESLYAQARQKNMGIQQYLSALAARKKPGESGLVALDWINGVRSTLMDFDLSGLIIGITMDTAPEDIYRALLESSAFGAWKILKAAIDEGVKIERVWASGGISLKNPLLMQIYADVFNMDIHVVDVPYSASVGSAILAQAASVGGGFEGLGALCAPNGSGLGPVYRPVEENAAVYRELFQVYSELYERFGRDSDSMKKLRRLREKARRV